MKIRFVEHVAAALFVCLVAGTTSGAAPRSQPAIDQVAAGDGKYQITIDTSETPELTDWADTQLAPVVEEWYPRIVDELPSQGYEAPRKFSITFKKTMNGVAYTAGTRIVCAGSWFSKNVKGEGRGAVVHEMVHVVQQYGRRQPRTPGAEPNPGWLVEGIPDYIRWYEYEPQSHGTNIRNPDRVKYDNSYRVTANFLHFVINKYDKKLVAELNTAMREHKYNGDLWKKLTGKTADELNEEWKASLKSGK